MGKKQTSRRVLHYPHEEYVAHTLLDVYYNFTGGIYRMLKINPSWIYGTDEITSLFTIIGSVTLFVISMSYPKAEQSDFVGTLFNGSNFDRYGCNLSMQQPDTYLYGLSKPQFAIALYPYQFSLSALLSAAGRLYCEADVSFVVAMPDVIYYLYPELKVFYPREGAELLTNQLAFGAGANNYYTYSAKGAELGLSNYFETRPLLALLDVSTYKMYQQIVYIVKVSLPKTQFIFSIFGALSVSKTMLCAFVPFIGIAIAINLNMLHKYLRRHIIADTIKFCAFRGLIGGLMFCVFYAAKKVLSVFKMDLQNYIYSDNLFKSLICVSLLLSGMLGKFLKQENPSYAQEQAICSFIAYIVSLVARPQSSGVFLSIVVYSIMGMYLYDVLYKKRITQRDWTRNASFVLIQLPIAYAICYKQLALLQASSLKNGFIEYLVWAIIIIYVLTGYSISIYARTSGPTFLFSATGLAALLFLQASTANPALINFSNNVKIGKDTTGIPLLNAEPYAYFFCSRSKQTCKYLAYGKTGEIATKIENDVWQFSMYKDRYVYKITGSSGVAEEHHGMMCTRAHGEVQSDVVFRGIIDVWSCE